MKIKIDLKIFIFLIIFIFTKQIEIYGVLMLFAFIHELGHVLAGILLKFKIESVNIMPFGVSVNFNIQYQDYNKKIKKGTLLTVKELIIASMGPITNLIITIIYLIFDITFFGISRQLVIYSNILIGIFNLIPIYPLDGGRILKSIIHIKLGLKEAYEITNLASYISIMILTAISSIAILYLRNIAIIIIIAYLWSLVLIENKRYKTKNYAQKLQSISENKTKYLSLQK